MTLMQEFSCLSDGELLRRMAAGDEAAFCVLYARRHGDVYRFALRMSGSAAIAEEMTQEVFFVLIGAEHGYSPGRGPLVGFLLSAAHNHVRRCLERDRAFLPLAESAEDLQNTPGAAAGDPLGDLTRQQNIEAVRRAVLTLPPDYREVVALCDLEEIEHSAAAKILGCPIGTLRSRLHHGRTMLVAKLRAARCLA